MELPGFMQIATDRNHDVKPSAKSDALDEREAPGALKLRTLPRIQTLIIRAAKAASICAGLKAEFLSKASPSAS
jgi:hypothetical protein